MTTTKNWEKVMSKYLPNKHLKPHMRNYFNNKIEYLGLKDRGFSFNVGMHIYSRSDVPAHNEDLICHLSFDEASNKVTVKPYSPGKGVTMAGKFSELGVNWDKKTYDLNNTTELIEFDDLIHRIGRI